MPATESELRERLARLVAGEETLRGFQAWFVPAFWDEPPTAESPGQRLAHEVELVISEYTSGAWRLEEALDLLRGLLNVPIVEARWSGGFPRVVTGTTSRLIRRSRTPAGPEAEGLQPAGIRYATGHG
jgi:hypothetical protein